MAEIHRDEWLATYHEGDSRLQNKRHGILKINKEKERLEFAVQTKEAEDAPFILVSYPIQYLETVNKIERRKKLKKHEFLEFTFNNTSNVIKPIFSFKLVEIDTISKSVFFKWHNLNSKEEKRKTITKCEGKRDESL